MFQQLHLYQQNEKKIPIWSNQTIEHKIALEFQGPGLGQAKQMCRGQTVYCV
jgi:hypothetical protein